MVSVSWVEVIYQLLVFSIRRQWAVKKRRTDVYHTRFLLPFPIRQCVHEYVWEERCEILCFAYE